jgi:hypothetical protein
VISLWKQVCICDSRFVCARNEARSHFVTECCEERVWKIFILHSIHISTLFLKEISFTLNILPWFSNYLFPKPLVSRCNVSLLAFLWCLWYFTTAAHQLFFPCYLVTAPHLKFTATTHSLGNHFGGFSTTFLFSRQESTGTVCFVVFDLFTSS